LSNYPDGAWLVELGSLADPSLVPQSAAVVLGLQRTGESSYLNIITNYLREKRLLLLLDNCEHLLEASTELAYHLLLHCPQVSDVGYQP
jgi:predicted ATPase